MPPYPLESYRLVRLRRGAAPRLFASLARLIAEQRAEEGQAPFPDLPGRLRELARPASSAILHVLVGPGGRVLGYQLANACRSLGGEYAYVNETYVPKSRRGLGLGFVLMRRFVDWARARGFVHVYSKTSSPEMRRIAERLGARVKPADWVDIPLGAPARTG